MLFYIVLKFCTVVSSLVTDNFYSVFNGNFEMNIQGTILYKLINSICKIYSVNN